MSAIQFQIDGDDILLIGDWREDENALLSKLEAALGTAAGSARVLVWAKRIEFTIDGELVPLFVDEDGSAHIEMRKNSPSVKRAVAVRLHGSGAFQEVR